MTPLRISSSRLELVEITPQLAQANLEDPAELARLLHARIAATWPPEHWEPAAIRWLISRFSPQPNDRGWFGWHVVLQAGADASLTERVLIGAVGCKGPPDGAGVIEIGYGIVSEFQRRGFASEATAALIDWALRDGRVRMIAAETYPHLTPSLGVMRKLGMTFLGAGLEPNVVRYGVTRERWPVGALSRPHG